MKMGRDENGKGRRWRVTQQAIGRHHSSILAAVSAPLQITDNTHTSGQYRDEKVEENNASKRFNQITL